MTPAGKINSTPTPLAPAPAPPANAAKASSTPQTAKPAATNGTPPSSRTRANEVVAAHAGINRAPQTKAHLTSQLRTELPPLPPGSKADPKYASQHGVRLIIDTRRINPHSKELGRQISRQSLIQYGLTAAEADALLRAKPEFTFRTQAGTGTAIKNSDLRARVESGSIDNTMTAETVREIEQWRTQQRSSVQQRTPGQTAAAQITSSRTAPAQTAAARITTPRITAAQPQPAPAKAKSEEGFGAFLEGALAGDFSENDSWSAIGGQTVVGLIPVVGQIADARDIAAAVKDVYQGKDGALPQLLIAGVAVVPGLDFLKGGSRLGRKALEDVVKEGVSHEAQAGLKALRHTLSKEAVGEAKKELVTLNVARAEVTARLEDHLGSGALQQNAAAVVESARNSVRDHLKQSDLVGALRDVHGQPVRRVGDGYTFQHIREVRESLSSLEDGRDSLLKELRRYQPDSAEYKRLSADIEAINETTRRAQAFLEIK